MATIRDMQREHKQYIVESYESGMSMDTSKFSTQRSDPLCNHTKEIIDLYKNGIGCMYKCVERSISNILRENS